MLPLQVNTILEDFTEHATPAKLNAAYANYGQPQFWQDLHSVSIKGPLGKDYAYSSAGTELIAHTLEKIYGMPYDDWRKLHHREAAPEAQAAFAARAKTHP